MDASELWSVIKKRLENDLTSATYNTWVKSLRLHGEEGSEITLVAEDTTSRDWVRDRYLGKITDVAAEYGAAGATFRIVTQSEASRGPQLPDSLIMNEAFKESNLRSKYLFENFVKGRSNELAFAASVAVAESPGQTRYNPLFLYGSVGLGKTHLMHSIGNHILKRDPYTIVFYTTSENMTNEFITSLRESKNKEFRDKYRNVDVLLVDDIQFLSGKESTQEEFFHTFDALYGAAKQIVISSDRPPVELSTLERRLTTRFGQGLIVDITPPDFETRTAILEKKAQIERINVPADVIRLLASSISSNIRELEGALTRVLAHAKLTNSQITLALAEKALKDLVNENDKREITVDYVQEAVAEFYKVTVEQLRSKNRTAPVAFARHAAMYLTHKLMNITLEKVGEAFGNRHHTTVINACNVINGELESNDSFRLELLNLEKKIKGE